MHFYYLFMDTFNIVIIRDEGHTDGGECYVTFTACNVNIGNGFIPKSGIFQVRTLSQLDSAIKVITFHETISTGEPLIW